MGRYPIDIETKQKRGTLRKQRRNPTLFKPKSVKTLHAPDWLGDIAAARWRWAVKTLARRGALTEADVPMLELFCVLYQQMRETAAKGQDLKPALVAQLRNLGESFGFTPAARSKVHVPETPKPAVEEERDSWAAFRKGKA